MNGVTKQRGERLRSNVPGPAELRRLAKWYVGISDDYVDAIKLHPGVGGGTAPAGA